MLLELMSHVHLETCSAAELKKIVSQSVEYLEVEGHLQIIEMRSGVQCLHCLLVHEFGQDTCEFCGKRIAVQKPATRSTLAL